MYGYSRGATYNILKRRGIPRRTPSEALKGREFTDEWKQKISDNHHDVSGKNNPMYGEPSPNPHGWGNRTYVPHLGCKVRSRWEAEIANTLRELGIKHEYEKRRIHLGDCSTLPDFYLPDHDLYLEVKGRVNKHFKKVLRLLPELRPDIVFLVIYEAEYNAIQKDPSVLRNLIASAS